MKCEYCGSNLDLEAEVCPYCGRVNEQAKKHVSDMKKYNYQFNHTRRNVYSKAQKYSDVSVRAGILAILFIIFVIFLMIHSNIYRIRRSFLRMSDNIHSEEILGQMDAYLAQEDYLGFSQYCQEKQIRFYEDAFESYSKINRAVNCYGYVYEQMMQLRFSNYEGMDLSRNISSLGEYLGNFYQCGSQEKDAFMKEEDYEKFQREYGNMKQHIAAWMVTYFHMTPKEAESLEDMSSARIAVFLEDKINENQ